jgi:DNA-binding transcriptional LysR family regulator
MPRENVSDLLAIRITAGEHSADTILWPALARLLPEYPDIKVEIIVDYGLTDIVAERYDAGVRLGVRERWTRAESSGRRQFVFNNVALRLNAALAGLGLAHLLEHQVQVYLAKGRLVRVLADGCPPFPGFHPITRAAGSFRPPLPCWSMRYGTAIETAACQCFRSDGGHIELIQSGTQSECFPPVAVKKVVDFTANSKRPRQAAARRSLPPCSAAPQGAN